MSIASAEFAAFLQVVQLQLRSMADLILNLYVGGFGQNINLYYEMNIELMERSIGRVRQMNITLYILIAKTSVPIHIVESGSSRRGGCTGLL